MLFESWHKVSPPYVDLYGASHSFQSVHWLIHMKKKNLSLFSLFQILAVLITRTELDLRIWEVPGLFLVPGGLWASTLTGVQCLPEGNTQSILKARDGIAVDCMETDQRTPEMPFPITAPSPRYRCVRVCSILSDLGSDQITLPVSGMVTPFYSIFWALKQRKSKVFWPCF